ncbi:MAG: radical SAM family heme chaperone HemW [Opitutales bacterium]|nr:radical SAM family heme chaperone HemW [Opitutales bacterium]
MNPLGLYVHVPFCAHACDFCAFYQEPPRKADIDLYFSALEAELRQRVPQLPYDTIFWGGGTPGILSTADIIRLGQLCLQHLSAPPKEWTIELAPSTVKKDKALALRELGVNRVSLGVQSFDASLLDAIGRRHQPAVIYRAIDILRDAGFENMNIDLMFALPGQSFAMWQKDLEEAVSMQPTHISTYCLTFEEDTALWSKLSRGEIAKRTEFEEAAFYRDTWAMLEAHGYAQYEISNFARAGYPCRHNLNTWDMQEWIGVGPSGSTQYGRRRSTNIHNLQRWADGYLSSVPCCVDEQDLSDATLVADALVFGLRMNQGVCLDRLRRRFAFPLYEQTLQLFTALQDEGLLTLDNTRVALTESGRLVADQIAVHILELLD